MFSKIRKIRIRRKKIAIAGTLGESVRDGIIEAGIKAAQESGFAAGNVTEKFVEIVSVAAPVVNRVTELVGGGESGTSLARIAFKATKDIGRGDTVCTGLCAISVGCEVIALSCSTIKFIPGRGRVYVYSKIISKSCMTYRNLCAGENC